MSGSQRPINGADSLEEHQFEGRLDRWCEVCNLSSDNSIHTVRIGFPTGADKADEIVLTPNWVATCRWFAHALDEHSFETFARMPVASFMEQVRYLAQTDPVGLQSIIDEFSGK